MARYPGITIHSRRAVRALALAAVASTAVGALACSGSELTGPETGFSPGVYGLTSLDAQPSPFITDKTTYSNGVIRTNEIAWDSLVIAADSTFTRTIQRDVYEQQPGQPRERRGGTFTRFAGVVLIRGNEVLLAPIGTSLSAGEPGYFSRHGDALQSRILRMEGTCNGDAPCTITARRYVDAVYAHR